MIRIDVRTVVFCTSLVLASAHFLEAQDRSRYRDFQLGSDLLSVAKQAGLASSDAKVVHQRPALMQQLEWRPRYLLSGAAIQTDPVREIRFRFYDDKLFRMVVDYDQNRTEGLIDADMTEMISAIYGPSSKPTPTRVSTALAPYDPDGGTPLAEWGDGEYSITLLRAVYPVTFRMVIASRQLEKLAQAADAEAVRLDAREAPQREVARQKKEAEDRRVADEKARLVNKAAFRP